MTSVKRGHESVVLPVYTGSDDISGQIEVELTETTQYNHLGLKCFLIGQLGTPIINQKYTNNLNSPPSSPSSAKN